MLTKPALTIFVSYKDENLKLAQEFKTFLEGIPISEQRELQVFIADQIPTGGFYLPTILTALSDSDCFILLYTDTSAPILDWLWCLYESGFYHGKHEANLKLIVLHHPHVQPPASLNQLQNVPATPEKIFQLLTELFCSPLGNSKDPLISQDTPSELFHKTSQGIAELFKEEPKRTYYTHYIRLLLTTDESQALKQSNFKELPDTVQVETNNRSLELFGLASLTSKTWGDLVQRLREKAQRDRNFAISFSGWHQTLGRTIRDAINEYVFLPELPTFLSFHDVSYNSTLRLMERHIDASHVISVIFAQIFPDNDPRPEGALHTLSNMLMVARYFRWGVCEHYLAELRRLQNETTRGEDMITEKIEALQSAVARSINLAARAHLLEPTNAVNAMRDDKDKEEIEKIYDEWDKFSESFSDVLNRRNPEGTIQALETLRDLNKRFMEISAKRYYEEIVRMT